MQNDYGPHDGMTGIYALCDPRNPGVVMYVGQATDPQRRLYSHIHNPSKHPVKAWIRSLRADGVEPYMFMLQWVSRLDRKEHELKWIYIIHPLLNACHWSIYRETTKTRLLSAGIEV